jgi:Ca-activated chloride channel family protein
MVSVNRSWVDDSYQAVLRVAFNTTMSPDDIEDKPLDLILVLDQSGSMSSDNRMVFVKEGIRQMIDELDPEDRVALVSYSTAATLRADLGEYSGEELQGIVAGLNPEGGTNIYEGLAMGMQIAAENLDVERQTRVLLLSDGNITVGRPPAEVIDMADDYVADGIGLTTIGVGDEFNVELMRGLAERGAGNFYYVEDAEAVTEVFTEELNYFAVPIALGLDVEVESDPSHQFGEVLGTSLWNTSSPEIGFIEVPAVFLASRKDQQPDPNGRRGGGSSLFIAMQPLSGTFEGETMATVRARYRLPGSDELIESEITVDNPFRDEAPEAGYASHEEMLEGYAMYNMFLGLRRASQEAQGSHDCALRTLQSLEDTATAWNEVAPDEDIGADLELVSQFESNLVGSGADAARCESDPVDWEEGSFRDGTYDGPTYCSVGSGDNAAPLGLALLALILTARRRRRTIR